MFDHHNTASLTIESTCSTSRTVMPPTRLHVIYHKSVIDLWSAKYDNRIYIVCVNAAPRTTPQHMHGCAASATRWDFLWDANTRNLRLSLVPFCDCWAIWRVDLSGIRCGSDKIKRLHIDCQGAGGTWDPPHI